MKESLRFLRSRAVWFGLMALAVALSVTAPFPASAASCQIGEYANLRGCDFSYQNLSGARLGEADFSFANLTGAVLSKADMGGVDLTGADLTNAVLKNTFLGDAELIDTVIEGADFSGAFLGDASYNMFRSRGLVGTPKALPGGWTVVRGYLVGPGEPLPELVEINGYSVGPDADLREADLSDTDLSGLDLSGANLSLADLRGANLTDANLTDANLTDTLLSGANLRNATLVNATLLRTSVDGASFMFADFTNIYSEAVSGYPESLPDGWELLDGTFQEALEEIAWAGWPEFAGQPTVGIQLSIAEMTFEFLDPEAQVSYEWYVDGKIVALETRNEYFVRAEDLGKAVVLKITATKQGFRDTQIFAEAGLVQPGKLLKFGRPSMSGKFVVGEKITSKPGAWDAGVKLTYQWLRDGKKIDGATSSSYVTTASDLGKLLSVQTTGEKTGYSSVTQTSTSTKVEIGTIINKPIPTVSGSAKVGQTLTTNAGAWDAGVKLTYQWLRDGQEILGETLSSYKVSPTDVGLPLRVMLTASLDGYESVKVFSVRIVPNLGIFSSKMPSFTGNAAVGNTLKANSSSWAAGTKITYQWLANGVAIKGATASSFKIPTTLKGKKISVKVTQSATGYVTASMTSASVTVK